MDMKKILQSFDNTSKKYAGDSNQMKKLMSIVSEQRISDEPILHNRDTSKQVNPIDTVTLDIPLLLRIMEYAKEDAKTDMDLHHVTEKLVKLSASGKALSMKDYDFIVGSMSNDPVKKNTLGKLNTRYK